MGCEGTEPILDSKQLEVLVQLRAKLHARALRKNIHPGTKDYHLYVLGTVAKVKKQLEAKVLRRSRLSN